MKAILVIEMPTSCSMCKADKICKVWNEEQNKWKGYSDRLDGCPLKPMPEKMKVTKEIFIDYACLEKGYECGWNACLEELEK